MDSFTTLFFRRTHDLPWPVAVVLVLLAWCVLRLGPTLWSAADRPVPSPALSEVEKASYLSLQQDMAQSEADQARWAASLALAPGAALQRLQALARTFHFQVEASGVQDTVTPFRREMVLLGHWDALAPFWRQASHQVPSLGVRRLVLVAAPEGRIELRLQLEAHGPAATAVAQLPRPKSTLAHDPFADKALARKLLLQASQGPAPPMAAGAPLQSVDPQTLRLLGVAESTRQRWALLGHQGQVFSVQSGDRVGWHRGRVMAIHEDRLEIQEHVLDSDDAWTTRSRVLHFAGQGIRP
jgi:Tfp pilus assembly protein PilP